MCLSYSINKGFTLKQNYFAGHCYIIQQGHSSVLLDYRVAVLAHSPLTATRSHLLLAVTQQDRPILETS